jgi:outer membrane protein TolC
MGIIRCFMAVGLSTAVLIAVTDLAIAGPRELPRKILPQDLDQQQDSDQQQNLVLREDTDGESRSEFKTPVPATAPEAPQPLEAPLRQAATPSAFTESPPTGITPPGAIGTEQIAQSPPPSANFSSPTLSAVDLAPLNPNPDLLSLPTQPQQVEPVVNQALTLKQSLELARRNNRTLQVAELQLRQSRAALREALADQFPNLSLSSSISQADSASRQINLPSGQFQQQLQLQRQQQQQLQQELQTQQQTAQRDLEQQIQALQRRFQGPQLASFNDQQNVELQQQINLLTESARLAALPPTFQPITLSPLNVSTTNLGRGGGSEELSNTFDGTLSLRYTLFTSGGRAASIQAAREQVRFAELEVQQQTEQLQLDVFIDYYNAQQAEIQVRIAQAAVNNSQVSLRDTVALERAGLGTRFDVLQAQVSLANAKQNLSQARNLQLTSRQQLSQRLSLSDQSAITLADPVGVVGLWDLSLEQTIVLALSNRVELAQRLAQRDIAIQNRRLALSTLGPQVSVFANLDSLDRLFDETAIQYGYSVGVQFSWRLFEGGAARASAARQSENIAIAQTQFANTKDQIRLQVEVAYSDLQTSFQNIQTSRTAVQQAAEGLRLARLRFQSGVGTQADVTQAEADLTQAQGNLLSATLDYNRALATLQRAVSYAVTPSPLP